MSYEDLTPPSHSSDDRSTSSGPSQPQVISQDGQAHHNAPTLPYDSPLSNNTTLGTPRLVKNTRRSGKSIQKQPVPPTRNLFSVSQCLEICALKCFIKTADGALITDDTVSMIMTHRSDNKDRVINCAPIYQYLLRESVNLDNESVRQVWNHLDQNLASWELVAHACYWGWMDYMKAVWHQSVIVHPNRKGLWSLILCY